MHDGHDHHYDHNGGGHSHGHGHNQPPGKTLQWQTPHQPHQHASQAEDPRTTDLDLVEASFVEAFSNASDVTSFLRVAGIPFVGEDEAGRKHHLLRVETDDMVDIGSVTPLLGGGGMRYDPLPAKMTSRRKRLSFLFHDGAQVRRFDFASARALKDISGASSFEI